MGQMMQHHCITQDSNSKALSTLEECLDDHPAITTLGDGEWGDDPLVKISPFTCSMSGPHERVL
jgi:hypothetical protein